MKILSLYDKFEAYLKMRNRADVLDQGSPLKNADGDSVKRRLEFAEESTKTETSEPTKEEQIDTQQKAMDDIIPNTPPAIVVLKSVDETYLGQILSDNSEQVYLNVSHLSCNFVLSEPTGFTNRAVPDSFLNKYSVKDSQPQEAKGTSAAAMLKERDAQLGIAQDEAPIVRDGNEQWANINGNLADDENDHESGYKQENEAETSNKVSLDSKVDLLDFDL